LSTRNDVVRLAVEDVDVATVPDPNLRIDGEVVLLVRLRPENHLAVPDSCHDPKLALALKEFDAADLFVSPGQAIDDTTTEFVGDECFSDLVTHGNKRALFINIASCDPLLHWDPECDVSPVLTNVPEAAQVFSIDCSEEIIRDSCLIAKDVHKGGHFVADQDTAIAHVF